MQSGNQTTTTYSSGYLIQAGPATPTIARLESDAVIIRCRRHISTDTKILCPSATWDTLDSTFWPIQKGPRNPSGQKGFKRNGKKKK